GVGLLNAPLAAPGVDLAAVALDELAPGRLVGRRVAQPDQQRRAGPRIVPVGHGPLPPTTRSLSAPPGRPATETTRKGRTGRRQKKKGQSRVRSVPPGRNTGRTLL